MLVNSFFVFIFYRLSLIIFFSSEKERSKSTDVRGAYVSELSTTGLVEVLQTKILLSLNEWASSCNDFPCARHVTVRPSILKISAVLLKAQIDWRVPTLTKVLIFSTAILSQRITKTKRNTCNF